jgi:hypothetical protein
VLSCLRLKTNLYGADPLIGVSPGGFPMRRLTLTASDFQGPNRWYWQLCDSQGGPLADQEIKLDPACWEYAAYVDLYGYLKVHAAPDRRSEDERRILDGLGRWMGRAVLGETIGNRLADEAAQQPLAAYVTVGGHRRKRPRSRFMVGL